MAKGKWKVSAEKVAIEAYLVLIKRQKATKRFPKGRLIQLLVNPDARAEFLRLCLEYDDSDSLVAFRKGLLLSIQALGPSKFALELGVNRVSLYRMLSPKGNPGLRNITRISNKLGLRLWLVDEDFILRRQKLERPKDVAKDLDAFEEWMDVARPNRMRKTVLHEDQDDENS